MHANYYAIITDAIEVGLKLGWNRAHKHTETPELDDILEAQENAIIARLSEFVTWNDEHESALP